MKQKDKSIEALLLPLINEPRRSEVAVETLVRVLSPRGLVDSSAFSALDKWAVEDLDRLLAAILSALRLQTFSIHDPRVRALRRRPKKREHSMLRSLKDLGLESACWIDHVSMVDLGDESYFISEPYELDAQAFSDFEKMKRHGWIVRVFPPLATYFPTQAVPVLFRKLLPGEISGEDHRRL